ncbi:hypothetical protein [Flavobacterium sp. TSSA_36]|uniref:hypothetical protein n=1 Tax=Flavobacterium sp. TSSA_36 TaxID=3447669 RepID=UPI003F39341F
MDTSIAYVICIKDKFFYKFSKDKKALTAWTLAGSKLFVPYMVDDLFSDNEFHKTIRLLRSKKVNYVIKEVCLTSY